MKVDVSSTSSSEGSEQLAIGVLPTGASDSKVELTASAEVVTGVLQPGGRVVFAAQIRSSHELHGTLVKSVTYTDASGKRVTWRR